MKELLTVLFLVGFIIILPTLVFLGMRLASFVMDIGRKK